MRLPPCSRLGMQSVITFWPKEDINFETPCPGGKVAQRGIGLEKSWLKLKANIVLQKKSKKAEALQIRNCPQESHLREEAVPSENWLTA